MTEEAEKTPLLTVDELFALGKNVVLERDISFEITKHDEDPPQQTLIRRVVFRRLTYEEIDNLRKIPKEEPLRYACNVIHSATIAPTFENTDIIAKAPHGFVRHYSRVILEESGKDPFLGKG